MQAQSDASRRLACLACCRWTEAPPRQDALAHGAADEIDEGGGGLEIGSRTRQCDGISSSDVDIRWYLDRGQERLHAGGVIGQVDDTGVRLPIDDLRHDLANGSGGGNQRPFDLPRECWTIDRGTTKISEQRASVNGQRRIRMFSREPQVIPRQVGKRGYPPRVRAGD